jgi:hypothetical protein
MKMRKPEGDVRLVKGEGYVVEEEAYRSHLSSAIETKQACASKLTPKGQAYRCPQVSNCRNFKAVSQKNLNAPNLESTGIGACACSRHGCFVPHSVVDFQKGERLVLHAFLKFFLKLAPGM